MWVYLREFFSPSQWGDLLAVVWPLLAIVVGFFLVGMMKKNPASAGEAGAVDKEREVERGRLHDLPAEAFLGAVRELLEACKLEVDAGVTPGSGGVYYLSAQNPAPLTGGRILVEVAQKPEGGAVDAPPVVALLDNVRAEQALKGLYVTPGAFTSEAKAAAVGTQVDLLDGDALIALLKKHCPRWLVEQ